MPFDYQILGKDEAEHALRDKHHKFTHIVSCQGGSGYKPYSLDDYDAEILEFTFDDVRFDAGRYVAPTEADIQKLLDFNIPHGSQVLFHCAAGVSRSSACALIKLCQAYGEGFEAKALDEVIFTRPCAYPNETMIRLADKLLGRKGLLKAAYAKEYIVVKGADRKLIIGI